MSESLPRLFLGLVTGFCLGFILQKAGLTRFRVIVGQLLLRDFTVLTILLVAVVTGAMGVHLLASFGVATLQPKPALLASAVTGGLVLGTGMALLGWCPVTAVAAAGEGRRDARVGILGMVAGALALPQVDERLLARLLDIRDVGPATLSDATGIPARVWVALIVAVVGLVLSVLDQWTPTPPARTEAVRKSVRSAVIHRI